MLLFKEWSSTKYSEKLRGRKILFVNGVDCFMLSSEDGSSTETTLITDLCSNQEEADTRIILHLMHMIKEDTLANKTITIRSPDTDVFILLLHFCVEINDKVYFDTGCGNKRRLLFVNDVISNHGKEFVKSLLCLHAFTGCDTTSSFIRRGKVRPFKLLKKTSEFWPCFTSLGLNEVVTDALLESLESFVCVMYGKPTHHRVNQLRHDLAMIKFKSSNNSLSSFEGTDLCFLPPCQESLVMHIKRANYQTFIWKNANVAFQELPSVQESGWRLEDGTLQVLWNQSSVVLPEISCISAESTDDDDNNMDSDSEDDSDKVEDIFDDCFIDATFSDNDDVLY